jgi:ABC-type branched-subunit amino acid transport system ATPase component
MSALLQLEDVWAGYGGDDVLRGLSVAIEPGSLTCVVGPNGAGKSTLSRVVSGLLRPRRGEIRFDGTSTVGLSPRAILDRGIVQVPQDRSVFPSMTVEENVRLGGYSLRNQSIVGARFEKMAARFPMIHERRRDLASALSGGQQKLVEFARAMMLEPRLLVIDEPDLGLEPRARTMVLETVRELNADGCTILLVEQNVRAGLRLATHGVVMQLGRIVLTGSGDEILARPDIGNMLMGGAATDGGTGAAPVAPRG